jgi:hypothetical protein
MELTGNNIDSSGVIKVAEYLKSSSEMHFLFLDHNLFNDDDAGLLAEDLMNTS